MTRIARMEPWFSLVAVDRAGETMMVQSMFADLGDAIAGAHEVLDHNRDFVVAVRVMRGGIEQYTTAWL